MGFEIDGEQAYKDRVRGFQDGYVAVLSTLYGFAANTIGAGAGSLTGALVVNTTIAGAEIGAVAAAAIGSGVAAATTAALVGGVALWLPPDLIMADADGFDFGNMARRTSTNFRNPARETRKSEDGISIVVEPCEAGAGRNCEGSAKGTNEYRERRLYKQPEEDSRYELILRYRRAD